MLVETRRAADLLGATPMDRPEDVEANPVNGRVYVMLTNNVRRTEAQVNAANPRPRNIHGHVLEIIPPGRRASEPVPRRTTPPTAGAVGDLHRRRQARRGPRRAVPPRHQRRRLAVLPRQLRLRQPGPHLDRDRRRGRRRRPRRRALRRRHGGAGQGAHAPLLPGADGRGGRAARASRRTTRTLFLSIQHPAEEDGSSYDQPSTRWPDFRPDMPPRPSVIAITKRDGGPVG